MTDTITIRPTPAADLERGDLIRRHGETRQILSVGDYGEQHVVIDCPDGPTTFRSDETVDVVVPPEPEPESAWPTEPVIRILDGCLDHRDVGDLLALRVDAGAYRLYDSGDEAGIILRGAADDGIEQWEGLSVVPTEAVRTLAKRLSELDIASPLSRDAAIARVVDAAESLALVADSGEED